jgi:hypothetical protein
MNAIFANFSLLNGEELQLLIMTSIVTCNISNILSFFDLRRFIKFYKLELLEVLNPLSYFSQP